MEDEGVMRVRLTGRATRFLGVLREFGHIDEDRLDELFVALTELAGGADEPLVDLPDVRRMAAAILFGPGDEQSLDEIEKGVLAEDWPLLFS